METLLNVLKPFEQVARELSAETALLSQIIPPVLILWLLMHVFFLPTTPTAIQREILFAKIFREEKCYSKYYLNHFSDLGKSHPLLWNLASKFLYLKRIVESFLQKGNKTVKWPKTSEDLWNICIPLAITVFISFLKHCSGEMYKKKVFVKASKKSYRLLLSFAFADLLIPT